ncbi:MAG: methionine synthase [Planctomycetaceae bacterium]|nr:methionine synthase [Planctomycetaceae bacterium]
MSTSPLLEALTRRILVLDGAMGTSLQSSHDCRTEDWLGRENCSEILTKSRPDMIQRIHESFLAAGADCVETNTFGANLLVGAEFDDEVVAMTRELNRSSVEIARAACDAHATPDRPRFVLGSMGPGTKLVSLGQTDWDVMLRSYEEQARGLLDGGVDAFLVETCQDLLQVRCAVNACLKALEERGLDPFQIPIMVSITIETTGTMLLGSDIASAVNALRMLPIASLGLNCATGPVEMTSHVEYLCRHWDRFVSVVPNAGLPVLVDGQASYPLKPRPFAEAMRRFVEEKGVNLVGGCCGTTPEHIATLVEMVGDRPAPKRDLVPLEPGCSSLYGFTEFRQDNSFLIVAERTNANGSRKFKRLLDAEDWDALVSMGREELRGGSHLLDVCVDFVGRDGARDMAEVAGRYATSLNAPIMIDSTEAPTIEAGLKRLGGKCVVNSINLEDGERRLDEICPLLKAHGAACVALTIDEDPQAGMAKTADRKLEIATRIHGLFTGKWGLDESDLLFDPLTFTIATGVEDDRALGHETLEGIRLIAERFPKCGILLGLSNISFGLRPPARAVLNSVFLDHARQRGLTAAIVHASKILPRTKIDEAKWAAAEWLIFDRRGDERPEGMPEDFDPLLHFIGLFPEDGEAEERIALESLTIPERLQRHIIDGEDDGLVETLEEALVDLEPLEIINDHLLAGMKIVGELFGDGRMQLPFVLQSAEVMKKAVAHLEPLMDRVEGDVGRGSIVLATVSGDVHDIGKNLVDIILTNNGYTVHNIGIKQSVEQIVAAWRETEADAIGMSGLLVKSVTVMEQNLRAFNELGISVPVILGGAALTRFHAEKRLRDIYEGPLYYGKDAFDGLRVCDRISNDALDELDGEITERLDKREAAEATVAAAREATRERGDGDTLVEARPLTAVEAVPEAPFFGSRLVEDVPLEEVFAYVNRNALYRGQWGLRRGAMSKDEYAAHVADHAAPVFDRLKAECLAEPILAPKAVYGWWPANGDGDDLVVFDAEDHDREIARFSFPRQNSRQRRCLADYFRPLESGERDVAGFHCVTMGEEVSRRARTLFEADRYADYLYLHGFGVECAEALAEMWHKRMRAEIGIGHHDDPEIRRLFGQNYRGCRYSFGYPACPDMSDQETLFRLLEPERIGCRLTENWQIDPEQSTSALVVHHPDAAYYGV